MTVNAPAPTFLCGFERSGTTLLTMLLAAHPHISAPLSVTGAWYGFADRIQTDYGALATRDDVLTLVQDIADHPRVRLWGVDLDADAIADAAGVGRFDRVVYAVHAAAAQTEGVQAEGAAVWANMDIQTLFQLERAAALFPDARFVQIVRDGRDVAVSFKGYKYGGKTVFELALEWSRAVEAGDRIGAALGDRYMRVRYEDLILDPAPTLTPLCGFMGVAFDPSMLDYAAAADRAIPADKRDIWPILGGPLASDRVGRWRRELGAGERRMFEEIAGGALARFGYDCAPSSFSPRAELAGAWGWVTRGGRLRRFT